MDVNAALEKITDGTERNIEGQRIYGRSWQEVQATLRLTPAAMAEATAHAKALGIEVGQEQVTNFKAYQAAMAGAHDVLRGVGNAIGEALMPMLTALGNWFGSIGPGLVSVFRVAIAGIGIAFNVVGLMVSGAMQVIKAALLDTVAVSARVGQSISAALHGDWAGMKAAWKGGMDELRAIHKAASDQIEADAKAANQRIADLITGHVATPQKEQPPEPPKPPPETFNQYQQELEEEKAARAQQQAAEGEFHEMSKAEELAYWQDILLITSASAKEKAEIKKTIAGLEVNVAKGAFDAQLADLKTQEAAVGKDYEAKLELAKQYEAKVGAAYGTDSAQFKEASKATVEVKRAEVEQLLELDKIRETAAQSLALAEVDSQEKAAQLNVSMHRETEAQLLAQEKTFEDMRFSIQQATLQKEKSLIDPNNDPVAFAKICAQIEALATKHAATLQGINQKLTITQQAQWNSLFTTIENDFTTNISKMLEGTEKFSSGIRNLFMQIGDGIVQMLVKMAVQWAATQIENLILGKSTASAQITAFAAMAEAAGIASFAAAPWPVDIGAPAFGAAMGAAAMSADVSPEHGYDVPAGAMPPLAQLHPKETVLPADLAQGFRDIIRGGGGAGAGGGASHFHFHTPDPGSIEQWLRSTDGRKAMKDATQRMRRGGRFRR
jgi:hypothetical protein